MDHSSVIWNLHANLSVFEGLLKNKNEEEIHWRPESGKWCLLEIISHLLDEEREDFRARLKHVLENPHAELPPIDPAGWVTSRHYLKNNYEETVNKFLEERKNSVLFLRELHQPAWDNYYTHPKFGKMSAEMFLSNWEAHDYLHMRQIISLNYQYLKFRTGERLDYAGTW